MGTDVRVKLRIYLKMSFISDKHKNIAFQYIIILTDFEKTVIFPLLLKSNE